jgi:thioesterase domain-containing protein
MDSPLPSICDDVNVGDDAHFFCDMINFANRVYRSGSRIDYERLAKLPADERFTAAVEEARTTGMLPADMPDDFIHKVVEVGKANVQVLQGYRPTALKNPVLFFAANSREALIELSGRTPPSDYDLGWSEHVGQQVNLHRLAGDHFSIMAGDAAAFIARELARDLNLSSGGDAKPQTAAK